MMISDGNENDHGDNYDDGIDVSEEWDDDQDDDYNNMCVDLLTVVNKLLTLDICCIVLFTIRRIAQSTSSQSRFPTIRFPLDQIRLFMMIVMMLLVVMVVAVFVVSTYMMVYIMPSIL